MHPKPTNPSTKDLDEAIQATQQRLEETHKSTHLHFTEQIGILNTKLDNQQQLLDSRDENLFNILNARHDSLTALITTALQQRPPPSDPPPLNSGNESSTSHTNAMIPSPASPSQPQNNHIATVFNTPTTGTTNTLYGSTAHTTINPLFTSPIASLPAPLPINYPHTPSPQPTVYTPLYPQTPQFNHNPSFGPLPFHQSPYQTPAPPNFLSPTPQHQGHIPVRTPKIELIPFDGTNPLEWLFQAEQFFAFYNIPNESRLSLASFYMKGDALSWYKWMYQNHQLFDWVSFSKTLELRFGPSTYENHQAQLFKLRQYGSVSEYQTQFEKLGNRVLGLPPDALLNCFISGLIPEIRHELAVQRPYTITQAIGLAKLIEAKIKDSKSRPTKPYFQPTNTPSNHQFFHRAQNKQQLLTLYLQNHKFLTPPPLLPNYPSAAYPQPKCKNGVPKAYAITVMRSISWATDVPPAVTSYSFWNQNPKRKPKTLLPKLNPLKNQNPHISIYHRKL